MNTRSRVTWVVYGICVLLVVEGLAWMTWRVLRLEAREAQASARVEHEQRVRVALWQLDSALSPLIAAEARRPYFHYRPFYAPGLGYADLATEPPEGEPVTPSPLLVDGPEPPIRLHFELSAGGWTSPQAPPEEWHDRVSAWIAEPERLAVARAMLAELESLERATPTLMARPLAPEPQLDLGGLVGQIEADTADGAPADARYAEPDEAARDYFARAQNAQIALDPQDRTRANRQSPRASESIDPGVAPVPGGHAGGGVATRAAPGLGEPDAPPLARRAAGVREPVEVGPLRAEWLGSSEPALVFVRDVSVEGASATQGFWLDWADLRATLMARLSELLPGAELVPLTAAPDTPLDRRLAVAPIALRAPGPSVARPTWTPMRMTLAITWLAVLSATLAVGVMLRQSESLSARRARFVSAVTHELRTPLTTFCLYSQMLADGVTPEERRAEYLATLRDESSRLAAVVEDVLAYARLGRRRAHDPTRLDLAAVIDELMPRLRERASRDGIEITFTRPDAALWTRGTAAAIERIALNLVENACRYAAEGRRIDIAVRGAGRHAELTVRDFGPGVAPADRDRIFHAFARARRDDDTAASGLGLGLALARGLARELGGTLTLEPAEPGARFVLRIPAE